MSPFYGFILAVLAVWRVTHLLNLEDGPWEILARLRRLVGSGSGGELLDCFNCLSLWVALPFALLLASSWRDGLLLWLALSGGAILLERACAPPPPPYFEESAAAGNITGENP
jgi:hypothetical protein